MLGVGEWKTPAPAAPTALSPKYRRKKLVSEKMSAVGVDAVDVLIIRKRKYNLT